MEGKPSDHKLSSNRADFSVSAARVVSGLVPLVGSLFAEIIAVKIPGQRLDRVTKFVTELESRLGSVEKELLNQRLNDNGFAELLAEGLRQSAHALSDERRRYIASLIMKGLSAEDVVSSESRHLLRILDEINDIEVVWLRFYREPIVNGDKDFRETHKEVLEPKVAVMSSPLEEHDQVTIQESYREHLAQLGLLQKRYRINSDTRQPEFDEWSGAMKEAGYELTSLGGLLLREIGLGDDNSQP